MTDQFHDSELQAYETSAEGARELAAANSAAQASRLLDEALDSAAINQKALASLLGVTEGRVSQVLNGDGNVRVGALARYLRVLGYELKLAAVPVDHSLPALPRPSRHERKVSAETTPSHGKWTMELMPPLLNHVVGSVCDQALGIVAQTYLQIDASSYFGVLFSDRKLCGAGEENQAKSRGHVNSGPHGVLALNSGNAVYCEQ